MTRYLIIFLILCAFASSSYAQETTFHGFIQGNISSRITGEETGDPDEGGDFLSGEERLRGEVTGGSGASNLALKVDLFHDSIAKRDKVDIREGYIDYRSMNYDVRIGRQIITWGVGDLLFINDIYPKNYAAFFSGQPFEYLKIGSDAAKISAYSDILSAELVIVPFFEPYTLPDPKRFFLYNPMPGLPQVVEKPRGEVENTEIALRIYRPIGRFDTSVYVYRGLFKLPGMKADDPVSPTKSILFYPQLSVYGLSLQGSFANGVLSAEGGYYDSLDDRNGNDPAIENSTARYLVGYSRQLWTDFTAGIQYYGEVMQHYSKYEDTLPSGFLKRDSLHQLITIRLTQMFQYNTVRLSLFSFYSPDDKDYFVIPEARYNITDSLWTIIGANLLGGKDSRTFFGQLDKNDNLYATLRYEF